MPRRHDFDTPWKEALALYLPRFFEFFFPSIERKIDWGREIRFLDKELRKLERRGETGRREADTLVGLFHRDGSPIWVLVHIEVQSQGDSGFLERMFTYHVRIRDRYNKPLTSLAILGDASPHWRPSEFRREFWGTRLSFAFPVVKLIDYRDRLEQLEVSTNPFACWWRPRSMCIERRRTLPREEKVSFAWFEDSTIRDWIKNGFEPSFVWWTGL